MTKPYGRIYKNKTNVSIDALDLYNVWPVGSIYISVNNTNPSTYFGGTWVSFGAGRCLVGVDTSQTEFNTAQKTGGSKYLQEHYHDIRFGDSNGNGVTISNLGSGVDALDIPNWNWSKNRKNEKGSSSNLYTNKEGTGTSGNLQPYITVYMWKRIN